MYDTAFCALRMKLLLSYKSFGGNIKAILTF